MVGLKELEDQLKQIGCSIRFWGRAEMRELANILLPGEKIQQCLNGQYEGGFAMLAATDLRVLLIDKKPMYLTLEDVRFDMIAEVDYNHNLFNATLRIFTPNQTVRFTGYNQAKMRKFFNFVQQRVMEIRQHYLMLEQTPPGQATTQQSQAAQPSFSGTASVQAPPANTPSQPSVSHLQVSMGGIRRVAPVISAYTRLPMMTRQRRYMGFGGFTPRA
ncbi:MAG TPA: PH domain-containing protein [Candidatus Saccharimonadales bacterium]|nr:PH domain-containing protein [Candidatus Saccharimonadales bacterium]